MKEILVLFTLYTALSLSSEAIFTAIADAIRDRRMGRPFNRSLPSRTNLWIIPMYAMSAIVSFGIMDAFAPGFFLLPWWGRGAIYAFIIYIWEFIWGWMLESLLDVRLWMYRQSEYRIWRYIHPWYFPIWFSFGLSLEWIRTYVLPRMLS